MLPYCLACLEAMGAVGEVIAIDSFSTDRTMAILGEYQRASKKEVQVHQRAFEGFASQWNYGIDRAGYDWIFFVAADETWTPQLDRVLLSLDRRPHVNGVRVYTLVTFGDMRHYLSTADLEPQVRVFRRGFARFEGRALEEIIDGRGRSLMSCHDPDILTCHGREFDGVWRKHHQLLKSEDALAEKGRRWEALDLLGECAEKGIPVNRDSWASWKGRRDPVAALPEAWYDASNHLPWE